VIDPSRLKAVVFDLDDTLCGYWDASKKALRQTFAELDLPGQTPESMVRHWAEAFREFAPTLKQTQWYEVYLKEGQPTRTEQMRRTLAKAGCDDPDQARKVGDRYGELRDCYLELFPDARTVLDRLAQRWPLGLMTNGPADIQRQEIATCGLDGMFELVLIEGEQGEGKPNVSVFKKAETHFGAEPDELLMVGNSYGHDIEPALRYGWRAIWIRRPSDLPPSADLKANPQPEERPAGSPDPDAEIRELSELLKILDCEFA